MQVVALAATPSWTYPERLDLPGGGHAVVRPRVSTLATRDELSRLDELPDDDVLVLLTDEPDTELGASIKACLAGEKVLPLDRWQQVMSLFSARGIDPSLVDEQWAVEALITAAPAGGYPAVPSGFLDRETALTVLAHTAAGLDRLDLDLTGLLQWSLDSEHVERWCLLDAAVREGFSRWLVSRGGDGRAVNAVLRCLAGDYRADAVAVGIVLAALAALRLPAAGLAEQPRATGLVDGLVARAGGRGLAW